MYVQWVPPPLSFHPTLSFGFYDNPLSSTIDVAMPFPSKIMQGFQQRCAYMALQTPSEGMRDSFWKAVWRYQAKVVVSLGRAHPAYWPQAQGHSVTCGKLEVQHQSTCTQDGGIVKRSLHVSNEVIYH